MAAGIRISYIRILLFVFGYILLVSIRFNSKSPNFYISLLVNYGILRKISYLCPKFRRSLDIAKYRNEQKVARFHIVTYII